MKHNALLIISVLLAIGLLASCDKSGGRLEELEQRLDRLESGTIASVSQQVSSIKSSITSLVSAPALPATTLQTYCYGRMFAECTSLSSVEVKFTDWNYGYSTSQWLKDVPATGTFTCPSGLDTSTRSTKYVPSGWSVTYL